GAPRARRPPDAGAPAAHARAAGAAAGRGPRPARPRPRRAAGAGLDGRGRQVSALETSPAGDPLAVAEGRNPDSRPALPVRTVPRMAGRQKAAVLLIALGPEKAAEVFKHLREEEIESLSLEMAKSGQISPDTSAFVFEELAAVVQAYDSLATG